MAPLPRVRTRIWVEARRYWEAVAVSRSPCKKGHLWYTQGRLPVIQKRWGSFGVNDARSMRGDAAGR